MEVSHCDQIQVITVTYASASDSYQSHRYKQARQAGSAIKHGWIRTNDQSGAAQHIDPQTDDQGPVLAQTAIYDRCEEDGGSEIHDKKATKYACRCRLAEIKSAWSVFYGVFSTILHVVFCSILVSVLFLLN